MIVHSLLCFPRVGGFLSFLLRPHPVLVSFEQFVLISEKEYFNYYMYMYVHLHVGLSGIFGLAYTLCRQGLDTTVVCL